MQRLRIFPSVLSLPWCARRVRMRGLILILIIGMSVGFLMAQLGSDIPTGAT